MRFQATALGLNPEVYHALQAVDASKADASTRYYLEHTLLEYRLSGIDKDAATRERVRKLSDELTMESLHFQRNIAESQGKVVVKDKAELEGLPADYIARHAPAADGTITITTDEPDYRPVMTYAKSEDLRRQLYLAYYQRAYPANKELLQQVLKTRSELAHTLGFANWGELATADKLIKNPANVKALLAELEKAAEPVAKKEYAEILAFAQQRQPGLTVIPAYSAAYWMEQYQREAYGFDSQAVRAYFPFAEVQRGVLDTAARLFHVKFVEVKGLELWDPSVTVFDVMDGLDGNGKKMGRIYLDMHPRAGKNKWFNAGTMVTGVADRQLPEARLNGNFAGGGSDGDPGLMQYSDVVTFFHEFGHMMHSVLGSHQEYVGESSFNVEWDFVEAPSQMLEEFFRDIPLLQSFARHYQTGEVLPAELIRKMKLAGAFGRADWMRSQLYYTTLSLDLHDQDPKGIDLDRVTKGLYQSLQSWGWIEGNRMYASFGHLTGYSSNYYTYAFDKVIALDFFAQFDPADLLGCTAGQRYRKLVLEQGGSRPGRQMVQDFLGRDEEFRAMSDWLNEEFAGEGRK
jgi:thimet oligopeptidase